MESFILDGIALVGVIWAYLISLFSDLGVWTWESGITQLNA
jgi:hypothetical protein